MKAAREKAAPAPDAAAEGDVTDLDRDSLHILPISILPIAHSALRRARMVKNSHLDSVIELFNAPGCGSGQLDVTSVAKQFNLVRIPVHPDIDLLQKLAALPSFDVYSLRIFLRANNIEVTNKSGLSLSPAKIASLSEYMAKFTRPLITEIFGEDTKVEKFTDIIGLFHGQNAATARARLDTMADKLGISIMTIPKFLEDYGDIFMSLSYYRQCLDQLLPQVDLFMDALNELRNNYQLSNDRNLMNTINSMEEVINGRLSNVTGRLENFERSTNDMWRDLTAERFHKIESLIGSYHTTIGGVLCALTLKMSAWSRLFPKLGTGGLVGRAGFVMSDMRRGIDRICAIEDNTPILAALND